VIEKRQLSAIRNVCWRPEALAALLFCLEAEIMTDNSHKKPESDRGYERKRRSCLRCQKQFNSSWPGERVCTPCKSTTEWREGIAA
jgi:hypothetical protein